jgi:ammonia channel protein AmtB
MNNAIAKRGIKSCSVASSAVFLFSCSHSPQVMNYGISMVYHGMYETPRATRRLQETMKSASAVVVMVMMMIYVWYALCYVHIPNTEHTFSVYVAALTVYSTCAGNNITNKNGSTQNSNQY